jgi:DNA-entry nuclease
VFGGIGGNSTQQTDPPPVSDEATDNGRDYVVNKNTKKFHYPSCSSADDIKSSNRWDYHGTREELINMGYVPCKRCHP